MLSGGTFENGEPDEDEATRAANSLRIVRAGTLKARRSALHPAKQTRPRQSRLRAEVTRSRNLEILAWALGLTGALACGFTLAVTVALGLFSAEALGYLMFIATGLLGALVATREPRNSVGWLMCAASLAAILDRLPNDYAYFALVTQHGSWPLGGVALWLGAWAWVPLLGLFFPMIVGRFPDGKVPPRWRAVDWLAVSGTAAFAVSVALAPAEGMLVFLPSWEGGAVPLAPLIQNPLGASLPADLANQVRLVGLALIGLGVVAAVASLVARFRGARGDERLQLKWLAYSGVLMVAVLGFGGVASIVRYGAVVSFVSGPGLLDALVPFDVAALALPIALAIAILRYRLYDIELIINRTLVYGSLTAILGAAYTASSTLLQRLFVSVSGQKSDAAVVLSAFVVVVAFSPAKDWIQKQVDHRLGRGSPSSVLGKFRADVEAVVTVLDVHQVACRLLDQAVAAFDVRGAALYLQSSDVSNPHYSVGRLNSDMNIEVVLRHEDRQMGRLVLGSRRGDVGYTEHDRDELQRSADLVGEALALAEHLGHQPLPSYR